MQHKSYRLVSIIEIVICGFAPVRRDTVYRNDKDLVYIINRGNAKPGVFHRKKYSNFNIAIKQLN
jgi:hypothetical protein